MTLDQYKISFNPIGDMHCVELLDFKDYPILSLITTSTGAAYLSYLECFTSEGNERRLFAHVSYAQLLDIRMGNVPVRRAFECPQSSPIYVFDLDEETGTPCAYFAVPLVEFTEINSIPSSYFIYAPPKVMLRFGEDASNALALAHDRRRVILDLYIQGAELADGIKHYAFSQIFLPTAEIIREAFDLSRHQFGKLVSYSNLRAASLGVSIELDYELDLFKDRGVFTKLAKLIALMSADTKDAFDRLIPAFRDESFIQEYIKVIQAIRRHNLTVTSTLADPQTGEVQQTRVDKLIADKVKAIIDEEFDAITDTDIVEGVFLDVNFNVAQPSFAIKSFEEEPEGDEVIKGKIDDGLRDRLTKDHINLTKRHYTFKIRTTYKPETTFRPKSVTKVLLDYSESVGPDASLK